MQLKSIVVALCLGAWAAVVGHGGERLGGHRDVVHDKAAPLERGEPAAVQSSSNPGTGDSTRPALP